MDSRRIFVDCLVEQGIDPTSNPLEHNFIKIERCPSELNGRQFWNEELREPIMPVTAAALLKIGLKAGAKKFGEKAGAAVFTALFGDVFGSGGGLTAAEMKKILDEALKSFGEKLKVDIKGLLDGERSRDALIALMSLADTMDAFSTAPEAQTDLLDEAARDARLLTNAYAEMGEAAIEHYVYAVTLFVAVYEARAAHIHEDNKKVITHNILPAALVHYRRMYDLLLKDADQRVKVTSRSTWGPPAGETVTTSYRLHLDGEIVGGASVVYPPLGGTQGEEFYDRMKAQERELRNQVAQDVNTRLDGANDMVAAWQEKYQVNAERTELIASS